MADDTSDSDRAAAPQLELFWRPGCGFCMLLRRSLDRLGIDRVEHNIWDDPDAATIVRSHANGNETVPTVVVGDRAFVNPSAGELIAHLDVHHPELLPEDFDPPEPGIVERLASRVLG
jgi:mycoredoxin